MYFNITPKSNREDFFGQDYQVNLFKSYLQDDSVRLIVIKGLRRVGKTSLLNIGLQEAKVNFVKIDVRDTPFYDRQEFFLFLLQRIKEKCGNLWEKILSKISGISVNYQTFSLELFFAQERNISSFFSSLNEQLKKERKYFILAFDEVQLLKAIKFDYFLASLFDNYPYLRLVLTGSEMGLVNKFLGKEDYDAPLFGRAYLEINLDKIKEEAMAGFLVKGFKQLKKKITLSEIKEVLDNFDGIIGWTTYYGWYRGKELSHEKALEKVKIEGKIIVQKELDNFLATKKAKTLYLKIIRYLAQRKNNWSLLRQSFLKEGLKISDSQLSFCLRELIASGFIEKLNEQYFLVEPLLGEI